MVKRSREERLEMNRMTARERRRKAKVLIGTLQEQVGDLTRHNDDLRRDNALLRAQLQAVTAQNQNVATISSVGSSSTSSMSTNPAEAGTTTAAASTSAGSAASANPSPMAAPSTSTCSTNHNLSDPVTAASLVLRLQQLQQQSQQQQQPSLAAFSSPPINQALATNPVIGSTNFQAQIDQLRQQQVLRMLGLQVPAQMAMQHRPSSSASAQIDPQLLTNNASVTAILQNLGLLGGTGALPNAVLGTANANANVVNVNTNALVQLLPALLGQQRQDQQRRMPPKPRPNTQGQPPQK